METNIINPEMITLARESRGSTQTELARAMGIRQGSLSKMEKGLLVVSDESIQKFVKILRYPEHFFYRPGHRYTSFYRKKSALTKRLEAKGDAIANIISYHVKDFFEETEFIDEDIFYRDLHKHQLSPEEVARQLRAHWNLPSGPINNLTEIIEDHGIVVVYLDETLLIDGITLKTQHAPPIIFLNKNLPGCRMRLTLAHELGHIVMHDVPSDTTENEAYRFAAEFLMPRELIRLDLRKPNLKKLANLKPYWKVSMGTLLKRAESLNTINSNESRYLWSEMSKRGYRKVEPVQLDLPVEIPTLIDEIIHVHLNELKKTYTIGTLCEKLRISEEDFYFLYGQNPSVPQLRLLEN